MAKSKKKPARPAKPARRPGRGADVDVVARIPARAQPVVETIDAGTLRSAAREITRFYHQMQRGHARGAVAIGLKLEWVAAGAEYGRYQRWVTATLPFTRRTADNFRGLARWATDHPALFERLAHLGTSKLYMLSSLPVGQVRKLSKRKTVTLEDGRRVTLGVASVRDLVGVVAQLQPSPQPKHPALPDSPARNPVRAFQARFERRVAELEAMVAADGELARKLGAKPVRAFRRRLGAIGRGLGS